MTIEIQNPERLMLGMEIALGVLLGMCAVALLLWLWGQWREVRRAG